MTYNSSLYVWLGRCIYIQYASTIVWNVIKMLNIDDKVSTFSFCLILENRFVISIFVCFVSFLALVGYSRFWIKLFEISSGVFLYLVCSSPRFLKLFMCKIDTEEIVRWSIILLCCSQKHLVLFIFRI